MRFQVYQQVGGPGWMVYDAIMLEPVKTYYDKYAKEEANDLSDLLNRGHQAKEATATVTEIVQGVRQPLRKSKE